MVIPDDPKSACAYLNELALAASTPDVFSAVVEALQHKKEGIQVCAGRTLARWNDRSAITPLRDWLLASLARAHGHACVGQAAYALARFVGENDAPWVLDLYFGKTNSVQKSCLRPLVAALPHAAARERIVNELHAEKASDREAAIRAAYALSFPDLSQMLLPAEMDNSPNVRNLAAAIRSTAIRRAV
jgi:hypothetical protein